MSFYCGNVRCRNSVETDNAEDAPYVADGLVVCGSCCQRDVYEHLNTHHPWMNELLLPLHLNPG